jgi:hypothetical protein
LTPSPPRRREKLPVKKLKLALLEGIILGTWMTPVQCRGEVPVVGLMLCMNSSGLISDPDIQPSSLGGPYIHTPHDDRQNAHLTPELNGRLCPELPAKGKGLRVK